jgi:GNAT superfamily N-acetyltransferase
VRRAIQEASERVATVSFRIESRDGASGQSNLRLIAETAAIRVGRIDYSVYQGEPAIEMVVVHDELRRRGYGRDMVMRLQQEYAETEIRWGLLTEDGAKLYASLAKEFVRDFGYEAKRLELNAVEEKLARYDALGDSFHALVEPTDGQRAEFFASVADWNDLHDAKDELARYLAFNPPGKTLLATSLERPGVSSEVPSSCL